MIYFDNAATTKPFEEVVEAFSTFSKDFYFNPSSLHLGGIKVAKKIEETRVFVAEKMNILPEELFFISGATEGNNTVLKSVFNFIKTDEKIVVSPIEHKSIREICKMPNYNPHVTFLDVDKYGKIRLETLKDKIDKKSKLLSFIAVNNETGVLQNISEVVKEARRINPDILIHVDGVQWFAKCGFDIGSLDIDFFSASAHKIHGLKGVGILYKKKGRYLHPLIIGGGQEKGIRSGTENSGAIFSLGVALDIFYKKREIFSKKMEELSGYFEGKIKNLDFILLNRGQNDNFSPYIFSLTHKYIPASVMLNALSEKGIYVSTGSACNEKSGGKNQVLEALGFSDYDIMRTFRVSFSVFNEKEEIDRFVDTILDIDKELGLFYRKVSKK